MSYELRKAWEGAGKDPDVHAIQLEALRRDSAEPAEAVEVTLVQHQVAPSQEQLYHERRAAIRFTMTKSIEMMLNTGEITAAELLQYSLDWFESLGGGQA